MKLYKLPRDSYFTIEDDPQQYVYLFKHVDGMYSVCYYKEELIHIAAWTDVQVVTPETESLNLTPKFT